MPGAEELAAWQERADRERLAAELLAAVGHDLRTPLAELIAEKRREIEGQMGPGWFSPAAGPPDARSSRR
jgi:signal transduction histidine kinase